MKYIFSLNLNFWYSNMATDAKKNAVFCDDKPKVVFHLKHIEMIPFFLLSLSFRLKGLFCLICHLHQPAASKDLSLWLGVAAFCTILKRHAHSSSPSRSPSMHALNLLKASQVCVYMCVWVKLGPPHLLCALRGHFCLWPTFWHKHRRKDSQDNNQTLMVPTYCLFTWG